MSPESFNEEVNYEEMVTASKVRMQDDLTCTICLEKLNSPRSLPCLHTFCEQCICEYISSIGRKAEHKITNYPCPICRTSVTPSNPESNVSTWASLLPHNFMISSLLARESEEANGKHECHMCTRQEKATEASYWCFECSEAFCDACYKMHGLMKLFGNHKIVKIEELQVGERNVVFEELSDKCPVHSSKVAEAYCFDHMQLCCVLCLTLQHRKCENVQAIEEIQDNQKVEAGSFSVYLSKVESAIGNLRNEKQKEFDHLEDCFRNVETIAIKTVNSTKDNLDSMLAVFLKELKLVKDVETTKSHDTLNIIDQFSCQVREFVKVAKVIGEYRSKGQQFIYNKRTEPEIHSKLKMLVETLEETKDVQIEIEFKEILRKLVDENTSGHDNLGKILVHPKETNYVSRFCREIEVPFLDFKKINIEFKKSICLKNDDHTRNDYIIQGGMCITDQNVLCGCSNGKVLHINTVNEYIKLKCTVQVNGFGVKRVTYAPEINTLYLSCFGGMFYSVVIGSPANISSVKNCSPYNGGLCVYDGFVYVIVGSEIQKLKYSTGEGLQMCFKTRSNCQSFNGLCVDRKNKRLVYTSEDYKIVCTTFEGDEIFSYKDRNMKTVTSVSVDYSGIIFAGDEEGSVYVISKDGKDSRTILDKPKNIRKLCDVWLDKSEKTLFMCGNQYIEMYDIHVV